MMFADADAELKKRFEDNVKGYEDDPILQLTKMLEQANLQDDAAAKVKLAKEVYSFANSAAQRNRNKRGKAFEAALESMLTELKIPFIRQVSHDNTGKIKSDKRGVVHDIVIDAALGDMLQDKIIISCKTSLRERYKQDSLVPCKKMYMVTLDRVSERTMAKYDKICELVMIGENNALQNMLSEIMAQVLP
jgi:flagellar hook-basal body complex protein FliE